MRAAITSCSERCQHNLAVLAATNLPYRTVNFNTLTVLFRGPVSVDFYPATGRWRVVSGRYRGHSYAGGAHAFLSWYRQHLPVRDELENLPNVAGA